MKKVISLLITICLLVTFIPIHISAAEENLTPNPEAYPDFVDLSYGALYAHATLGGNSKETWQRWHKDQQGVNYEEGIRYFFLPASADDNRVEIFNNYNSSVAIGDITIEPYTSAFVDYIEGEPIDAVRVSDNRKYKFVVIKSDAEASVYVNDATNSYEDYNGDIQETDLWSFLIQSKENSVKDVSCSIVDENGTLDTTLKKLKGRGNTNWKETDKKPFNLTFYDKTNIGGVEDKKFSFVSNAKDSTLLRNSIMYDLAYNVGSPYASDQSFVDFYVNGVYRGSYIACQKIDMGKNSVVSLKDTSDDVDTGFNFLVEVDVWNYKSDVYFVSDKGYHVVLKTPDLDDYDETDPSMKAKYDYIKETYQKLEDALYEGTLEDIEKICDLNSLASQYLLQEFGKNCDGGYTSSFFTYNAEEQKFYAAPLWDCDSDLGAVDCVRDGCTTSTIDHKGWVTRLAKYEKTINPYGQAFYVKGTTSDGKTFEDICKDMWQDKFVPMIDILLGNSEATGRLKSIDEYAKSIEKSAYINYIMWDFMWLCGQKNNSLGIKYTKDYEGELDYLKDWTKARADWISDMYGNSSDNEDDPITEAKTVYFYTNLNWDNVHYYTWSINNIPVRWPGTKAELYKTTDDGHKIYKADVPAGVNSIIFNNGIEGEQTVDITLTENDNFYTTTDSTGKVNEVKKDIYNVSIGVYTDDVFSESTTATLPTDSTSTQEPTEATTVTVPTDSTSDQQPTDSATVSTDPTESVPGTSDTTEPVTKPVATDPTESTSSISESTVPTTPTTESVPSTNTAPSKPDGTTQNNTTITTPSLNNVFGDANLDGIVNIKDVTTLQKFLAKLIDLSEENLSVSDTNRDGRVTISDATTIQKKLAQLINW